MAGNGEKIGQKMIFEFGPPPKKKWGTGKIWSAKKNQSCSNWPEMARKLVKSDFWIWIP